jgi:hypothetical protein
MLDAVVVEVTEVTVSGTHFKHDTGQSSLICLNVQSSLPPKSLFSATHVSMLSSQVMLESVAVIVCVTDVMVEPVVVVVVVTFWQLSDSIQCVQLVAFVSGLLFTPIEKSLHLLVCELKLNAPHTLDCALQTAAQPSRDGKAKVSPT